MQSLQEIKESLTKLPHKKYQAGIEVIKAYYDWKNAKIERERVEAQVFLRLKTFMKTDKETKEMVVINEEVYKAKLKEIRAETNYRRFNLEYEKCSDEFDALRKQANLIVEEIKVFGFGDVPENKGRELK